MLPYRTTCVGPRTNVRRVDGEDLADNQPVDELADRKSPQLSTATLLLLIRKRILPLGPLYIERIRSR